jgi:hypothetical protein
MPLTVRDVLQRLRQDGWYQVSTHWRVPAEAPPGDASPPLRHGRPPQAVPLASATGERDHAAAVCSACGGEGVATNGSARAGRQPASPSCLW